MKQRDGSGVSQIVKIYPLVSLIHELGHPFFAWIFGGKFNFSLGCGKRIFKKGAFSLNSIYFLAPFSEYEHLKWNNKTKATSQLRQALEGLTVKSLFDFIGNVSRG